MATGRGGGLRGGWLDVAVAPGAGEAPGLAAPLLLSALAAAAAAAGARGALLLCDCLASVAALCAPPAVAAALARGGARLRRRVGALPPDG